MSEINMEYDYSYILTDAAEEDFDRIIDYIINGLHNPAAATGLADEIEARILSLCASPYIGTPVDNPYVQRTDIRKVFVKNYVLFYFPDDAQKAIVIMRIGHTMQDQDFLLKNSEM